MGSWLNFNFKPIVIDMPPFKYNIYRGTVTKECSAGVIGDNISKRTAKINCDDNANQNEGNPTPQSRPSVENCTAENSSDENRTSDANIDLTSPPILDTRKLKLYQDKAADKNADLTPSSQKVDKWERMLDEGLLALKLSIDRDPDLTPPPDACIVQNCEGTCVETEKANGYGTAWGQIRNLRKYSEM